MYGAPRNPVAYHLELYRYWQGRSGRAAKRKAAYHYKAWQRAKAKATRQSARQAAAGARKSARASGSYRRSTWAERRASRQEARKTRRAARKAARQAKKSTAHPAQGCPPSAPTALTGPGLVVARWRYLIELRRCRKAAQQANTALAPKKSNGLLFGQKWKKSAAAPFQPSGPGVPSAALPTYESGAFSTYPTDAEMMEEAALAPADEFVAAEETSPWLWALGAVAVGGVGYALLQRRKKAAKAKAKARKPKANRRNRRNRKNRRNRR